MESGFKDLSTPGRKDLLKTKHKSFEKDEREFHLLIFKCGFIDGAMVWKRPQLAEKIEDACAGRNVFFMSTPTYTSLYGYI